MQKSCEVAETSQENLVDPGKVPPRKRDVKLTNKEEVRQLKVIKDDNIDNTESTPKPDRLDTGEKLKKFAPKVVQRRLRLIKPNP